MRTLREYRKQGGLMNLITMFAYSRWEEEERLGKDARGKLSDPEVK